MKKILLAVYLCSTILFNGCSAPQRSSVVNTEKSPCTDPLLRELQGKDISKMTDREFSYFQQKSSDCEAYLSAQQVAGSVANLETFFLVITVIVPVVALVILHVIAGH